ncbi:GAF and ANTAR domain-containing protein [Brevibacterium daeguense]|uniref:GAF and ANTAR domain-containing protein n=1 Tax=Brevibacterium daeguense TaxID=909936 RepID=A0ABP8EFB4_9MICO|nr:GAF and ANTAR domain-containing protein [Brevibacterium daeguense]
MDSRFSRPADDAADCEGHENPHSESGVLGGPDAWVIELLLDADDLTEVATRFTRLLSTDLSEGAARAWCSLAVVRDRRPVTVAFSHEQAHTLDEAQFLTGEGPCVKAVRDQVVVGLPDLASEERWLTFNRTAVAQKVGSVLAVPFELPGETKACLNVYFTQPYSYDWVLLEAVTERIQAATFALRIAARLSGRSSTDPDMAAALQSRAAVTLALGIIMGQNACTQDEAFHALITTARKRKVRMHDLAAGIIAGLNSGAGAAVIQQSGPVAEQSGPATEPPGLGT